MCVAVRGSCLSCENALSGPWTRKKVYKNIVVDIMLRHDGFHPPFVVLGRHWKETLSVGVVIKMGRFGKEIPWTEKEEKEIIKRWHGDCCHSRNELQWWSLPISGHTGNQWHTVTHTNTGNRGLWGVLWLPGFTHQPLFWIDVGFDVVGWM